MTFDFKEQGGCIGRNSNCELFLPDVRRYVSRIQAQIEYNDQQQCVLTALGQNPMTVDGECLVVGQCRVLHGGEQMTIGHFELVVVSDGAEVPNSPPADTDPFAVFFSRPIPVVQKTDHPDHAYSLRSSNTSTWGNTSENRTSIDHLLLEPHAAVWSGGSDWPPSPAPMQLEKEAVLLAAFRRGLGWADTGSSGLSCEWMERAGGLLREYLLHEQGTSNNAQGAASTSVQDNSNS